MPFKQILIHTPLIFGLWFPAASSFAGDPRLPSFACRIRYMAMNTDSGQMAPLSNCSGSRINPSQVLYSAACQEQIKRQDIYAAFDDLHVPKPYHSVAIRVQYTCGGKIADVNAANVVFNDKAKDDAALINVDFDRDFPTLPRATQQAQVARWIGKANQCHLMGYLPSTSQATAQPIDIPVTVVAAKDAIRFKPSREVPNDLRGGPIVCQDDQGKWTLIGLQNGANGSTRGSSAASLDSWLSRTISSTGAKPQGSGAEQGR